MYSRYLSTAAGFYARDVGIRPGTSSLWLVSFGDLLTLMLCFFLSLIAFGPLNRGFQMESAKLTLETRKAIQVLKVPRELARQPGITIAFSRDGKPSLKIAFGEEDFQKEREELLPTVLERMVSIVKSVQYDISEVKIEACRIDARGSAGGGWQAGSRMALGIRSQLLDAGIKSASLKLRSPGGHCAEFAGEDKQELGDRAQVTFVF
ncbi:MAG: hypothetical protein GX589_05495 [Deltaproteobacteria bacterium]|nr:hypothetical protein [Deltaproteobacteria bacterium]